METNFEGNVQERAVLVGLNADSFKKEQTATDQKDARVHNGADHRRGEHPHIRVPFGKQAIGETCTQAAQDALCQHGEKEI